MNNRQIVVVFSLEDHPWAVASTSSFLKYWGGGGGGIFIKIFPKLPLPPNCLPDLPFSQVLKGERDPLM